MFFGACSSGGARYRSGHTRTAGFTVLELLLVSALVAILGGMLLATGRHARDRGRVSRASVELATLSAALETYYLVQGDYPRTDQCASMVQALVGRRGPTGELIVARPVIDVGRFTFGAGGDPFLDETAELCDPWGSPYRYAYKSMVPWSNPGFVLFSAGPNGLADAALLAGGFPDPALPGNDDNLWANPP